MIAIYARVSTDAQVEAGLVSQLAELRRFAKEKYAGEVLVEFIDDGYTGADLERPQLERLRGEIRAGRIRVVLAYDPDRLSRDAAHLLLLMKEVEKGGATLDFVRGGFEKSDSGRLLLQMRGVIAGYERAQIRARTQRGRLEAARRGKVQGGPGMYGYDRADGAYVINQKQAEVIRRIFLMLLAGESVRGIASKLNEEGIIPQRGVRWRTSTLHRILKNRAYCTGITHYNCRKGSGGKIVFRPEAEWIPVSVPALIDTATFERAQEQLKRNAEWLSGRNDKRFYLLRGLLRCGECGSHISGCASHGRAYYRCCGRDRLSGLDRRCRSPWIDAQKIETAIINAVRAALKNGILEAKAAAYAPKVEPVDYQAEIDKAQREIDTWRRTEERAGRFLVAPEHADRQHIFLAELDRATKQRAIAEQRKTALEKAKVAAETANQHVNHIRDTCRKILAKLSRLRWEQWRTVLQLLLDEITVTGRKLEVRGILPEDMLLFRPQHQQVMPACGRHLQSALGGDLAAHVAKIQRRTGLRRGGDGSASMGSEAGGVLQ